jgi:tetratricopeptide (TPR) repeat protein
VAQHYLGHVYRNLGDYRRAVECYRKNLALLQGELLHEHFGMPGLPSVLSRSFLTCSLAECGAFAEGRAAAGEGVQIAEAADHPPSRVAAFRAVGFQSLCQGDLHQAIPVLERALDLAQVLHYRLIVPQVASPLGVAYARAGRIAEALPLLEHAVEQAVAMRLMMDYALWVVWLGEAYLRAGRLDEAYTQAQRALGFAQAHQERGHEAYALHLLGEMTVQRIPLEVERAEAFYRQAHVLAHELEMRPLVAHCHLGLGTLYVKSAQPELARPELTASIELYCAMDMAFWLPEAEAALSQVEGR